ncbi:MAG: RNA polymerase sigma factor [Candidatus Ratteibacteria bacterium]|nr:RNA polymerase sigma factor [Candidatus Ratteibacteria bacterium]
MNKKKDEELMMESKFGNREALEVIFHRYKVLLFNYAFRIIGNRADAEDVVSDIFLVLSSPKTIYTPKAKFSTWLYTVAHNACISRIRKRKKLVYMWFKRKGDDTYTELDIPSGQNPVSLNTEDKNVISQIKGAIKKLPLEQREAIILRVYQNLSYAEISEALGYSMSKVKVLIFRAREKLRRELLPSIRRI